MSNIVARIGIYGDTHLCSKNYGGHKDYATESLNYYRKVIDLAEAKGVTHLVCLGDFAQNRFHALEYRLKVEHELARARDLVNGNHYCICGNHDIATFGMTERDYYIQRGLFKESENLTFKGLNLYMADYRKETEIELPAKDRVDIILAHNFFRFKSTELPQFGEAIELDNFEQWYGADIIFTGHIHLTSSYSGNIIKGDKAHKALVFNVGCPCRMSYEKKMQEVGDVIYICVYDTGEVKIEKDQFELLPLEESFNLVDKETKDKLQKLKHADVSEIAAQLDNHTRFAGNPIDIINSLDVEQKYKDKAISLLKEED